MTPTRMMEETTPKTPIRTPSRRKQPSLKSPEGSTKKSKLGSSRNQRKPVDEGSPASSPSPQTSKSSSEEKSGLSDK